MTGFAQGVRAATMEETNEEILSKLDNYFYSERRALFKEAKDAADFLAGDASCFSVDTVEDRLSLENLAIWKEKRILATEKGMFPRFSLAVRFNYLVLDVGLYQSFLTGNVERFAALLEAGASPDTFLRNYEFNGRRFPSVLNRVSQAPQNNLGFAFLILRKTEQRFGKDKDVHQSLSILAKRIDSVCFGLVPAMKHIKSFTPQQELYIASKLNEVRPIDGEGIETLLTTPHAYVLKELADRKKRG